jgi:UDP-GlcNAc:undecaprenyl-phosphate GlcNAc-1-phosphate transferase
MIQLIIILGLLFLLELGYFQLADRFNIIDKPNERSSHTQLTIRGGGILFPIAWILYSLSHGFAFPYATVGVFLIGTISFLDDRMELSSRLRLLVHVLAFTLCFIELEVFSALPWWSIPMVYIVAIGCVNAINFMDGINGITGLYALAVLVPMYLYLYPTVLDSNGLTYLIASVLVFGFFNFRKKAKCFAGDVGSVSMGYLIIFFIVGLMLQRWSSQTGLVDAKQMQTDGTFEFKYILLLSLYGVDAILTIIHRLMLKENIFKAHRKHLYQYLANELKWPHLAVASLYACIQFGISIWVMFNYVTLPMGIGLILMLCILYVVIKKRILDSLTV